MSFEEDWPIGKMVKHKEFGWRGRIIGNDLKLGYCETSALEVHFYITEPAKDIKYTQVLPAEVERISE